MARPEDSQPRPPDAPPADALRQSPIAQAEAKGLSILLAGVLLAALAGLASRPQLAWPWVFREIAVFDPVPAAHLAVAVVFCLAIVRRRRSRWNHVVLAGLLLSMYLSTRAPSLGDREA